MLGSGLYWCVCVYVCVCVHVRVCVLSSPVDQQGPLIN